MSNEKYFNVYVDVLSQTLQQQVLSNVSLQAKIRLNEETLKEYENETDELQKNLKTLNVEILEKEKLLNDNFEKFKLESNLSQTEKERQKNEEISNLRKQIENLHNEVNVLNGLKVENEKNKSLLGHLETFKNDLIKTQEIVKQKDVVIKELNEQIEYLNLPPAKRKKIDLQKAAVIKKEEPKIEVSNKVLNTAGPRAKIIKQELPNLVVKDGGNF